MNKEAKEALRSAATLLEAQKQQAKSEIIAAITPDLQSLIDEEIEREARKQLSENEFDTEDLENPVPEFDDEDEELEVEGEEEFDEEDDLSSPPESASELESEEGTERISVEIDGEEYEGDWSPGDETIELELVDGVEGGEEEPDVIDVIDDEAEPDDIEDDEEFDLEDEEAPVEAEDEEELREAIRRMIKKSLVKEQNPFGEDEELEDGEGDEGNGINVVNDGEGGVLASEASIRRQVRQALLQEMNSAKRTRKPAPRKLNEKTRRLRKTTVEQKLVDKGLIPNNKSNSRGKLFENDDERKQVYDRVLQLLGD